MCSFLLQEADALQKAKDWHTAAAIKKRKEIGGLFKDVISKAIKSKVLVTYLVLTNTFFVRNLKSVNRWCTFPYMYDVIILCRASANQY